MDAEELKKILVVLKEYGVTEFELSHEGAELKLKRQKSVHAKDSITKSSFQMPGESQRVIDVEDNPKELEGAIKKITSPMVGTFYRGPSPEDPPFVSEGDVVNKGDVVGIIEAMKVMNEIKSEISGQIIEICVGNGEMSEFGEVLFKIK